jgi:hypothetical protein
MLGTSAGLAPSAAAQGEPPVSPTIIDEIMAPGETLEVGYRILRISPSRSPAFPPPSWGGRPEASRTTRSSRHSPETRSPRSLGAGHSLTKYSWS